MARKRQGSNKLISEMYKQLAEEQGFCTEETLGNAWAGYLLAHPEERDIRAQSRADVRAWYELHQHAAGQLTLPEIGYDPNAVEKDGIGNIWQMSRLTLDAFLRSDASTARTKRNRTPHTKSAKTTGSRAKRSGCITRR